MLWKFFPLLENLSLNTKQGNIIHDKFGRYVLPDWLMVEKANRKGPSSRPVLFHPEFTKINSLSPPPIFCASLTIIITKSCWFVHLGRTYYSAKSFRQHWMKRARRSTFDVRLLLFMVFHPCCLCYYCSSGSEMVHTNETHPTNASVRAL